MLRSDGMTNICLMGLGRTGTEIARVILEQHDMKLVAAVCSDFSSKYGKDVGEIQNSRNGSQGIYCQPAGGSYSGA